MEYTTEYKEMDDIYLVQVTGRVKRPDDSVALQQFARQIEEESGHHRFLFDMRQAQIVAGTYSTFETGTVPNDASRKQLQEIVALVYAGDLEDHKFMETVAVNRGYQLKVFDDMDEATEWLISKKR